MEVLQIANGYLEKGLYRHLFSHLEAFNVHNEICVPVKNGYGKKSTERNVKVIECFNSIDRYLFFTKQSKTIKAINNNFNVENFDIIHAHTLFSTGYAACALHKKYGIPYFVAVRNTDVNRFLKKMHLFREIGLRIMRDSAGVIFLSPGYRETVIGEYVPAEYQKEIAQKSVVIPNGIDDLFIANIPEKPHDLHIPLRIIYVGDINKNKNITTTLSAIELLKNQRIDAEYIAIGEEKDPNVSKIMKQKGFVKSLGKQPKESVVEHLREADIFVMPSFHETFGLVYAEAISQGIPVIYTKGQGFDGQFDDGVVGYAVDASDPHDVARGITQVLSNYTDLAQRCIDLVDKFDWNEIARQCAELYDSAVKMKKSN